MSVFLAGAAGQLGRELIPALEGLGSIAAVDRDDPGLLSGTIRQDLSDLRKVEQLLDTVNPKVIVNAAAYTAVDAAEDDPETAFRLNADLPGCMARWAGRHDCLLVHYSTDYVFAGDASRPYREQDQTAPLNVYGESKRAGEEAVAQSVCRHVVLRTSWVYSTHGHNFLLTMLRLGAERDALQIVDDQYGRPTWARNLARVSRRMIDLAGHEASQQPVAGLYHYCDGDAVSWYEFAQAIFAAGFEAGLLDREPDLAAVASTQFIQKATRPAYSVLDTRRIEKIMDLEPARLKESLAQCMKELINEQ